MKSERIRRAFGLPLGEALAALVVASLAIRLAPFRSIAGLLERRSSGAHPADAGEIAPIQAALAAWGRRLPWRTLCFEKGLAAHWMLLRRGRASTLFYGAATIDGELKAHVWVRSGDSEVVGCENAGEFALLAQFPGSNPVSDGSHH